ncbi:class II fructose-bisphosphate aldolase family protein [Candidatus Falkowbacteria bacterium]|nr:class II fructose-bisphosphate aldolase family protein [Candidatus Falkowbacteria bacterium]
MLVHIKSIVEDARKRKYAVGSFNIHNVETALGVTHAAQNTCSPIIIQVSESTIKYLGLKVVTHIVSTVAKNVATQIPIALHLDHGTSFASVIECINAGFTSVHIDASSMPLDENIKITKQVVEFARPKGVWVQGEVGAMVGGHGSVGGQIEIPKASVEDVIRFVEESGVDTIAAAIGTAHGAYTNEAIDFELLRKITEKVKIPFVLHGGSGNDPKEVIEAIKGGVDIINIGTDIKVAFCQALIKNCQEHPDETDPRKLLAPTIEAIEKVATEKIKIFGSAGCYGTPKYQI